ncbi:phospho-N-acetylmuramoyl-pentapeptide-transferase [uncultured Helicobacter sp.]|uniref:phospho-N-acetylmuramoyl-pentapeptide- transferase n=1 Tax=uncultured Helicobacter sp. TaxID=175537 RepID=UPI0037522948
MLYWLWSVAHINLFQYITFRAGVSFFLAFILSVAIFPYFIRWARARKANQPISTFVPHEEKKNTPTMGGIVFVLCTIIATLLCADMANPYVLLGLFGLVGFGLIGARDDFMKISARSNAGMSARLKMLLLVLLSLLIALCLANIGHIGDFYLPFMKAPLFGMDSLARLELDSVRVPVVSMVFWAFVLVASANAVNITDGLDGLATVPGILALLSLSVFVYISGHIGLSSYLYWPRVVNGGELIIVSCALIGSLFGFLWYNCHPAQVFMGDSGSLALGGFIAYMAIISHNEILLILIGIVFVFETLSVMLQIGSYKYRQKRIFLMAPIHHHFEKKGWAENKIIVRFWIIAILANIIALLTLKIR